MVSERLVLDVVIPWPCPCWVSGYRESAEPGIKLELWLWAMSHDIEHNHGVNDDSEVCLLDRVFARYFEILYLVLYM